MIQAKKVMLVFVFMIAAVSTHNSNTIRISSLEQHINDTDARLSTIEEFIHKLIYGVSHKNNKKLMHRQIQVENARNFMFKRCI